MVLKQFWDEPLPFGFAFLFPSKMNEKRKLFG